MLFKKKKDKDILEAIDFIKLQKKINKDNIKIFDRQGFSSERLRTWDNLYDKILKILSSIK